MSRFIEGEARSQSMLFPERLEGWIADDNPVRVIDVFVEEFDLESLGFDRAQPLSTMRSAMYAWVDIPREGVMPATHLIELLAAFGSDAERGGDPPHRSRITPKAIHARREHDVPHIAPIVELRFRFTSVRRD